MSVIGPIAASKIPQTFRRSRHARATGRSKITAPKSSVGRAPTANPKARLAAASHRPRLDESCNAFQIAANATIVSAYPQLIDTS
jgi:hypothetical protein